jgi:hypothetical protein
MVVPSSNRMTCWPSCCSNAVASVGTLMRAPNFSAWMAARPASSEPEMPDGNPR